MPLSASCQVWDLPSSMESLIIAFHMSYTSPPDSTLSSLSWWEELIYQGVLVLSVKLWVELSCFFMLFYSAKLWQRQETCLILTFGFFFQLLLLFKATQFMSFRVRILPPEWMPGASKARANAKFEFTNVEGLDKGHAWFLVWSTMEAQNQVTEREHVLASVTVGLE